jgi:hypothetical protein
MLTAVDTVDGVLRDHEAELGSDYAAYRNHVYRVLNFCVAQSSVNPESLEKIAIAAAFHDLGIWTAGTFDYLPPSIRLAKAYLLRTNRPEWTEEIGAMILEHHKISRYRGDSSPLVERFRRADWIDVSFGLRRFGLPRSVVARVLSALPNEGFHRREGGVQDSLPRDDPAKPPSATGDDTFRDRRRSGPGLRWEGTGSAQAAESRKPRKVLCPTPEPYRRWRRWSRARYTVSGSWTA